MAAYLADLKGIQLPSISHNRSTGAVYCVHVLRVIILSQSSEMYSITPTQSTKVQYNKL